MSMTRIRIQKRDPLTGRVVTVENRDIDQGAAYSGTKGLTVGGAAPVGHMNPGNGMRGITAIQQASTGETNAVFNGPIGPSKRDMPR